MRLLDKPLTQQEKRNEFDMLNGNIARICISDDPEEIVKSLGFATNRLSMIAYNRLKELKRDRRMSDLISRRALLEAFDENGLFLLEVVEKLIMQQPTAYDVDKVVEQLEELSDMVVRDSEEGVRYKMIDTDIAVDIVERGGINEV